MDIELVKTEELLDEVFERFDSCVFIGVRHHYETKDSDDYMTRWHGPISTIRGLIEILRDYAIDATEECMEDLTEDT